jgi:hypothetical protein
MITCNINISDGLVNGTTGILKEIETDIVDGFIVPQLLWFDFENCEIGLSTRDLFPIKKTHLTPIEKLTKEITRKSSSNQLVNVHRTQFPLTPAQALTIHKSQGDTYDKVVVELNSRMDLSSFYTAFSRAKVANGLFITGKQFHLPKIPEFSQNKRSNRSKPTYFKIKEEMERLRTQSRLIFDIDFDFKSDNFVIFYQNIPFLEKNLDSIICDQKIMESNILIFVETRSHFVEIENYDLLFELTNKGKRKTRPFGISIFGKQIQNCLLVERQSILRDNSHIEYIRGIINDIMFIVVYISPDFNKTESIDILFSLVRDDTNRKSLIVGDFNIDLQDNSNKYGNILQRKLKSLSFELQVTGVSTDRSTQIDLLFTNFKPDYCKYYESLISYHKPIFAVI